MMKTVFITGGNKGIGLALGKELGKAGWHVIIGARNKERAQTALGTLKSAGIEHVDFVLIDLSDSDSIAAAIQTIEADFTDLDLLINNAGVAGSHGPSTSVALDELHSTMQINFFGTFQLTQGLLPILEKNKGRIGNITITTGPNPLWNPLAYKASKAAQNVMMHALALDFAKEDKNIEIFSIHPGPTTTDLNGNMTAPGFHTAAEIGSLTAELLLDGKTHQGEFIELFPELR